ncbi:MAG: hypothetical protein ACYC7E_02730 [Armatimonadota bacterium]
MTYANWLAQLDVADRGVALRERDLDPHLLTALTDAGLVEYAGLDRYSDCCDCELGPGCPVERLGGTDDDPEYAAICPLGEALIFHEPDLRRWRLSAQAVVRMLAERLEPQQTAEEVVPRRLWEIGRLNSRVRLFLLRGVKRRDAQVVAAVLTERVKLMRGLVLVPGDLPDVGFLPANTVAISLSEVLRLDNAGITLDRALLLTLAEQLIGEKARPTFVPIQVPTGFAWSQVRVEFISDEDVRIWTIGEPVVRNFAELGLANARDQQPNRLWKLLQEFAAYEGVYNPESRSVLYPPQINNNRANVPRLSVFSPKLTTGLSQLADHLQKVFPNISGRPFTRYDTRSHQYRAVILLCWEPGYRQRMARGYAITS